MQDNEKFDEKLNSLIYDQNSDFAIKQNFTTLSMHWMVYLFLKNSNHTWYIKPKTYYSLPYMQVFVISILENCKRQSAFYHKQ